MQKFDNNRVLETSLLSDNDTPRPGGKRKKVTMFLLSFIVVITLATFWYLRLPQFDLPQVEPQPYQGKYHAGLFQNPTPVQVTTNESGSFITNLYKFLTETTPDSKPAYVLPSHKTDLLALDPSSNVIIWMGHSSYYMQIEGKRFLIDPVFSDNASPVPYTNVAFDGSNIYQAEDIPAIDYLLITHDHWDHLDHPSLVAIRDKVAQVVTPVGVGSYLVQWGYPEERIFEGDWFDTLQTDDLAIHILPAQHFSGRMLKRNQTLWASFAVISADKKIYIGGDSGYGPHFKQIYDTLGAFDVAILEAGQYNKNWPYIHMMPEETVQAAHDLHASAIHPSHNSKFRLSKHAWYEPLERISALSEGADFRLMTPMLGEAMQLDNKLQSFSQWWKQ